ncbi:hypothetical protein ACIRBX_21915 [Kitasatospora sp. NPDC096147]|uniref:hypothetical protein n=1 Tax=Kitasatospora sp. NPDC096147 TaxID=3364093 RepID=UPI0038285DC0
MFTALQVTYLAAPLAAWAALARSWRTGVPVAVVLLAWAGVAGALLLDLIHLRAEAEVYVAYAPVGALLVFGGEWIERRRLGARPKEAFGRAGAARATLGGYLVLFGLFAVPAVVAFRLSQPFSAHPGMLPLPAGVHVTRDSGPGGSCALHACLRDLTVRGPAGRPGHETAELIGRELRADGWRSDGHGGWTRPNGWLIDDRPVTIHLTPKEDTVLVELAGSDGFG